MSQKLQEKMQEQQNLRKVFQGIQAGFRMNSTSQSLEKKLSPFKRMLEAGKTNQSPFKFLQYIIENQKKIKEGHNNEDGERKIENLKNQQNQQFLQLYNNDPIFKCRVQRLFNQERRRSRRSPLKVPKIQSQDSKGFNDQELDLRTTFKSHCSQTERVLMNKLQSYKRLLKRQNSNDTCPSSQDNQ